jgi:hypothetical protein
LIVALSQAVLAALITEVFVGFLQHSPIEKRASCPSYPGLTGWSDTSVSIFIPTGERCI